MSPDKLQLLEYGEMHTLPLLDSVGRLTGQKLRDRSHDVDLNRIVSCNAYEANSSPLYSTRADCQGRGKTIVRLRDVGRAGKRAQLAAGTRNSKCHIFKCLIILISP